MKTFFFYLITLWGLLWLQLAQTHWMGGSGLAIHMALIATLYFGLARGALAGVLLGAVWGLFLDAAVMGPLGLQAFLLAAIGYMAGIGRRQLDETKIWTQFFLTVVMTLLYTLLYVGLSRLFMADPRPFVWRLFLQPFVNAVAAPVLFWFLGWWTELWAIFPLEH